MAGLWSPRLVPVVSFLLPFLVSWLLTASLIRLAPHFGLFDDPNARKFHTRPTPSAGGLAIYVAMLASAFSLPGGWEGDGPWFLIFGLVIMLLGLIDDVEPLPWQLRLVIQSGTAIAAVWTLEAERDWIVLAGAVIWIVGLTNAFNMLDNMDALSAGVAWIAAALLAAAALLRRQDVPDWQIIMPQLMLMGALSGFLWFNRPPARIFMGDAGSTFLGFYIGLSSLDDSLKDLQVPQRLAVPLCILAVPWYDMASVVALRLWQGRSPFHADKQHLSHRLVHLGLKPSTAVYVIYLLALASGAAGLLLYQVSPTGALLVGVQLACWWLSFAAVEYFSHYRSPQR